MKAIKAIFKECLNKEMGLEFWFVYYRCFFLVIRKCQKYSLKQKNDPRLPKDWRGDLVLYLGACSLWLCCSKTMKDSMRSGPFPTFLGGGPLRWSKLYRSWCFPPFWFYPHKVLLFFIWPESDHWLPLSLTDSLSLTHWLTDSLSNL